MVTRHKRAQSTHGMVCRISMQPVTTRYEAALCSFLLRVPHDNTLGYAAHAAAAVHAVMGQQLCTPAESCCRRNHSSSHAHLIHAGQAAGCCRPLQHAGGPLLHAGILAAKAQHAHALVLRC